MLLTVVGVLGVGSLALVLASASMSRSGARRADAENVQAYYVAETGVREAAAALLTNGTGDLGTEDRPLRSGSGLLWVDSELQDDGDYLVRSTAAVAGRRVTVESVIRLTTSGGVGGALYSTRRLDLKKGFFSDSYDSTLGPYASQLAEGETHVDDEGHVATSGDARVHSEVELRGRLAVGPDGEVSLAKGADDSVISGGDRRLTSVHEYPELDIPDAGPSLGKVEVSGKKDELGVLLLGPGDVRYEEIKQKQDGRITIQGPARIVVDSLKIDGPLEVDASAGHVELWVAEKFEVKKKAVLDVEAPADLLVIVGDPTDKKRKKKRRKVKIEADFTGVVYAPHARVEFKKKTHVFGAVLCDSLKVKKGVDLHYDEALGALQGTTVGTPAFELVRLRTVASGADGVRAKLSERKRLNAVAVEALDHVSSSWTAAGRRNPAPALDVPWDAESLPWVDDTFWPDDPFEDLDDADGDVDDQQGAGSKGKKGK